MYYFYLGDMLLPVTPGALTISTPSMNATKVLINDGEINMLKSPGLKEISFNFLLPQRKATWMNEAVASDYTATDYVSRLNDLKLSKKPFQFIVTRMTPDNKQLFYTNITSQIEDYTFEEDAASLGLDVQCGIKLKEYKEYSTKTLTIVKKDTNALGLVKNLIGAATAILALATNKRSTASKITPKQYTVKKGDTLWGICKQHLGDGQKYKEIAKLNKLENPNKIYPGQVLRLS